MGISFLNQVDIDERIVLTHGHTKMFSSTVRILHTGHAFLSLI